MYITSVLILSVYFSLTCAIYGVNIHSVANGVLVYVMWLISGKQNLLAIECGCHASQMEYVG